MSTQQGVARGTSRLRLGRGSWLPVLAALIAVAVAALIIALVSANDTSSPSATHPASAHTPLVQARALATSSATAYRYLGTAQTRAHTTASTTAAGNRTPTTRDTCVFVRGENKCIAAP